jgi:hypothetical protein
VVRAAVLLLCGAAGGSIAQTAPVTACEGRLAARHESGRASPVRVAWQLPDQPIAIGQPFTLVLHVCAENPAHKVSEIVLDADMPQHKHGMNYAPRVTMRGPGEAVGEGFVLHMPGRWRLIADMRIDGRRERFVTDIER